MSHTIFISGYISTPRGEKRLQQENWSALFILPSPYASAACRQRAPKSTGWSYELQNRGAGSSLVPTTLKRRHRDVMLDTPIASAHTPADIYPHTQTQRGNSCGVGVQIKTNADESSFCEAHQCSATGAVLLSTVQTAWPGNHAVSGFLHRIVRCLTCLSLLLFPRIHMRRSGKLRKKRRHPRYRWRREWLKHAVLNEWNKTWIVVQTFWVVVEHVSSWQLGYIFHSALSLNEVSTKNIFISGLKINCNRRVFESFVAHTTNSGAPTAFKSSCLTHLLSHLSISPVKSRRQKFGSCCYSKEYSSSDWGLRRPAGALTLHREITRGVICLKGVGKD